MPKYKAGDFLCYNSAWIDDFTKREILFGLVLGYNEDTKEYESMWFYPDKTEVFQHANIDIWINMGQRMIREKK